MAQAAKHGAQGGSAVAVDENLVADVVRTPHLQAEPAGERLEPHSDVHVQAPFRRHLAVSLLERVMLRAARQASSASAFRLTLGFC